MKTKRTGIALVIIGIILIAFAEFNYEIIKNVVDVNTSATTKNKEVPFRWSPIIGLVLLVGGIVIIDPEKNIHV